jgi:hypothetical protein
VKEIAEMSGDAAVERQGLQSLPPRPPSPPGGSAAAGRHGGSAEPAAFPPLASHVRTDSDGRALGAPITMTALSLEERVKLAEQGRAQLISVCLEHGINSEAASALAAWMQTMTAQQVRSGARMHTYTCALSFFLFFLSIVGLSLCRRGC